MTRFERYCEALGAGPGQDNAQAVAAAGLIAQSAGLIDDELAAMSGNQRSSDGSESGVVPASLRLVAVTFGPGCLQERWPSSCLQAPGGTPLVHLQTRSPVLSCFIASAETACNPLRSMFAPDVPARSHTTSAHTHTCLTCTISYYVACSAVHRKQGYGPGLCQPCMPLIKAHRDPCRRSRTDGGLLADRPVGRAAAG